MFKQVSSHSPFLMAITQAGDFKLQYANPRITPLLGYQPDEIGNLGSFFLDTMEEGDGKRLIESLRELDMARGDNQSVKALLKVHNKAGDWVYLQAVFTVFRRDKAGKPASLLSISEDVSEQLESHKSRLRLERMARMSEETFKFGKWEYDLETSEHYWTDGIYEIADLNTAEARANYTPTQFMLLMPEKARQELEAMISDSLKTGQSYTYQTTVRTHKGADKHLRMYGKPLMENGKAKKLLGITWDITEEQLLAEKLKRSTVQLSDAEQLLKFGTWEWNVGERQVKWSENFWNLMEFPKEMHDYGWIPIQRFYELIEPESHAMTQQSEVSVIKSGGDEYLKVSEFQARTHLGNTRHFISSTRILERDAEGNTVRAIGYSADITDMKLIQNALEKKVAELKRAYDEAEQFAYVASHDLQEPLRKVTSFGERLKTRCGANFDTDCDLYLNRMMDATSRMRVLIDNLLLLSRTKRSPDQFGKTDLNAVLEQVLQDLDMKTQEMGATIRVGQLPAIEGIWVQVQQLFQNLLFNSLKFSKPGIPNLIEVSAQPITTALAKDLDLDEHIAYALITVKDQGIGFEPQYAQEIFTPFKKLHSRSEYEGTGIGLAICKKVVQNHKGALKAEGVPGEGAVFYIALPIRQPAQ